MDASFKERLDEASLNNKGGSVMTSGEGVVVIPVSWERGIPHLLVLDISEGDAKQQHSFEFPRSHVIDHRTGRGIAQKLLVEKTGYQCKGMVNLGTIESGSDDDAIRIHVFLADIGDAWNNHNSDNAFVDVTTGSTTKWVSPSQLMEMTDCGVTVATLNAVLPLLV